MARLILRKRDGVFWAKTMTIAEIIAAKKAAAAKQSTTEGKHRADLVLSIKNPPPQSTGTQPNDYPYFPYEENRSLSQREGEAIPMTPVKADKEEITWHEALNAFESQLCLMRDPIDPGVVWLAVRPIREGLPPILINRLPWAFWNYPTEPTDQEPF
jgi:hypothetical protein